MDEQLTQSALDYHRLPTPRKISILPTKGLTNQRDLALAYGGRGVTVGPILLGPRKPAHILTPTSTVRRVVNMTALTAVAAQRGEAADAGLAG